MQPKESNQEIEQKIRNSKCTELFATNFRVFFNPGGEKYEWLLTNSKERHYDLEFFKNAVTLKKIEVNYRNKGTGYVVGEDCWGFGPSGYADLPNAAHVRAFKAYMVEYLRANCPNIRVEDGAKVIIRLSPTAKKSW